MLSSVLSERAHRVDARESATGDQKQALAALSALDGESSGASSSGGDVPPAPEPSEKGKRGPRRSMASPRLSRTELRKNVKTLLEENDRLRAEKAARAPEVAEAQAATLEQNEKEAAEAVAETAEMLFDMVAAVRGDHWRLSPVVKARLGAVWGKPLAPHWGAGNPWLIAAIATGCVIAPRLAMDEKRKKLAAGEQQVAA